MLVDYAYAHVINH